MANRHADEAKHLDSEGRKVPAEPAAYSADPALSCPACGRTYRYNPEADTLIERVGLHQGARA